jgi:hypothetical protein
MDLTACWPLFRFLCLGITSGIITTFARSENVLDRYFAKIYKLPVNSWHILMGAITAAACILLEPVYAAIYVTAVVMWPALIDEINTVAKNDKILILKLKMRLPSVLIGASIGVILRSELFAAVILWIVYYVIGAIASYELHHKGMRANVLVAAISVQTLLLGTLFPVASWSWAMTCAFLSGQAASPLVKSENRPKRCENCYTRCISCKNADITYKKW